MQHMLVSKRRWYGRHGTCNSPLPLVDASRLAMEVEESQVGKGVKDGVGSRGEEGEGERRDGGVKLEDGQEAVGGLSERSGKTG